MKEIVFLIQCSDNKGLLAGITSFFYEKSFNILDCQQHTDLHTDKYFMRIVLDLANLRTSRNKLEEEFSVFAEKNALNWSVHYSDYVPKVAILVSKTSHCLYDILLKHHEGDLKCDIPLIISNHPDLEYVADQFKIPYYCEPVKKGEKELQESAVLKLLKKQHIDLVVLARYMQILTPDFLKKFANPIINIHHAFLPAFQGANPYKRAYERGVKIIGATAHYVTEDLDEGPIIEQGVERVSHKCGPDDFKRIGRDIESVVLSKAVKAHLDHQIVVTNNRTVVFSN
jgi:formyltetrahydrofolate deformylase